MSLKCKWVSGNLVYYNRTAVGGLQIGEWASVLPGSGVVLSTSRTSVLRAYAEDGAAALLAGAYRAGVARTLLATACAAGDISVYGQQSQLKVAADYSAASGILGGEWGYVELASGGKVNVAGALVGHVDLPSGATVTTYLAGLLIKSNTLAGTHTGKVVAIYAANSLATAFDAFLALDASSNFLADSGAGGGTSKYLKVLVGGVAYSILVKSDA